MPMSLFCELYLKDIQPRRKPTTYESRQNMVQTHIAPYFNKTPIGETTPKMVQDWQNKLIQNEKGYSKTYLRTLNSVLSAIFNHAVRFYGLRENPVKKAGSIGEKKKEEVNFLTHDEFLKLIEALDPHDHYDQTYANIFKVAMYSGLRQGEIMALTFDDFKRDLEGRPYISVTKSYAKVAGVSIIQTPKNKSSVRDVYISEKLYTEVEDYISHLYNYESDQQIFNLHRGTLNKKLTKTLRKAGLKKITFHDLRHSFASMVINHGINFQILQQMLGHATPTETLNTYSHLYPNSQKQVVDFIDQITK